MADNDNTITLVGRIGQEPELRATSRGDVLNFNLATSERRRAADGTWSDGPTSWFRVAAWHDLARHAHASLHRGQQVIVRGVVTVREFESEGGGRSKAVELRATALGHDLRWGTTTYVDAGRSATTPAPAPTQEAVAQEPQRGADWGALPATPEPQREPVPATTGGWAAEDETPF